VILIELFLSCFASSFLLSLWALFDPPNHMHVRCIDCNGRTRVQRTRSMITLGLCMEIG
jgi:hypothetical protein